MLFNKLLIAEIGSVHDGSFGNALKLIDLAKEVGANAVKFQTHIADEETTRDAPNPAYFNSESRFDYFVRTAFEKEQWRSLKAHADEQNLLFMSSAFSIPALQMLEELEVVCHKIPSGEVTNKPLIEAFADTQKPILLSSGMSNWKELDMATKILARNQELCVLQCSSQYPCTNANVGLNIIGDLKDRYGADIIAGFSDHTLGLAAPIGAAALGAQVIEKHLTFSNKMYGSDAKHSMEPAEFKQLSKELRNIWEIYENPLDKDDNKKYLEMKKIFEKSIVAKRHLAQGHIITKDDLSFKKPGNGISAAEYQTLIGGKLRKDLNADKQFKLEDIDFEN